MQRLRQAEPSWLRSGQTTTLFSSDTEKDPVREARGGMAASIQARGEPGPWGGSGGATGRRQWRVGSLRQLEGALLAAGWAAGGQRCTGSGAGGR